MRVFRNKGMRRWCRVCGEKFVYTSRYQRVCEVCSCKPLRLRKS